MRNSDRSKILFFVSFLAIIRSECYDYYYEPDFNYYRNFVDYEGARWFCLVFGVCTSIFHPPISAENPGFNTVFQWSQLEFDYATPQDRERDISSGAFIPGHPAPIDADIQYAPNGHNRRVFITIPRFQAGVPLTFGVVTDKKLNNNPIIAPYPSWDWHTNPSSCKPNRLVSVYRTQIDECGRLWVLDTGRLLEEQTCPPQILAFDLSNDKLLHRYEIPTSQIESRSILVTPVVDVRDSHGKCKDTFVYVADCQTYSIIVYDLKKDTSWRITDKTMYPYPTYGTFSILGDSFDLMDGILGMALAPYVPGQDRVLFFHAMSSPTENWVYTSDIRNQTRFKDYEGSSPEIFHTYKGERHSQSAAEAMDRNGIMYFGSMSDVTINCWNTATEYGPRNIQVIANDKKTLQFASGVKVITNNHGGQELFIVTSRFQKVATETINPNEINFRIQVAKTDDLTFGTKCRTMGHHHHHPNNNNNNKLGGGYGLIRPTSRSNVQ